MNFDDMDMKNLRKQLIDQIIAARTEKGITQSQLAEMLGTQRSNISRFEKGDHNPSVDLLLKIATVLKIDLNFQAYRTDGPIPDNAYELRLYDETLLTFTLEEKGIEGLKASIFNTNNAVNELFPLDMTLTDEGV